MGLNFRQVRIVLFRDLALIPRNVSVILTFVFYVIFWYMVLKGFADGLAEEIEKGEIVSVLFLWFFSGITPEQLFNTPSTSLFLYKMLALMSTHYFVIIMTSDQTASDVGNRYFRYLATRCGRTELYLGRLLSVICITLVTIVLAGIAALFTAGFIDGEITSEAFTFAVRTWLWLTVVSLPFVALGAMVAAWSGSMAITMLTSAAVAFLVPQLFDYVELAWRKVEGIERWRSYFPGGWSNEILVGETTTMTILVPLLYTFLFAWIGCRKFKQREFP
ncbi:MAG: hypothetical protein CMI32_02935 [Opitutales bacterium]|jgi:hypothetical protein|nr:hypothetical protein [Opitutales bacterium]